MTEPGQRIIAVDALRGFALFGLFIVHMVEYFELYWYAQEPGWVHDSIFFLFGGKAYAIFGLLFGLSFFIMMDNQARRGVDFRVRFAWRLLLLAALGYLHGLLYSGDILLVLSLSGFLLILVWPLRSPWLLLLSVLLLLQAPSWLGIWMAGGEVSAPQFWSVMPVTYEIYAHGSLAEVVQRNLWMGQWGKWLFMFESGRLWSIIGMFLLGFWLGRRGYFRRFDSHWGLVLWPIAICVLVWFGVSALMSSAAVAALEEGNRRLVGDILGHYRNAAMTLGGVALFLAAWRLSLARPLLQTLATPGRLSLTIYVGQSLFGVPLFYGFGLALYTGFGQVNALLLGLALWLLQMGLAAAWLNRFRYGPLEWAWRAATYLTTDIRFRK